VLRRWLGRSEQTARRVAIRPGDRSIEVAGDLTVLEAALRHGVPFPHSCRVGTCGTCKCRLVSGKVTELSDKAYVLSGEEIRAGYVLACQSLARTNLEIELPEPLHAQDPAAPPVIQTGGTIAAIRPLTHDIVELVVEVDQPVVYRAGQYVEIFVPGVVEDELRETRSYSFASAPGPEPSKRVAFYVRHVPGGEFTTWLFREAKPGQRLEGHGPYGDFWLRPATAPILCMAGGSGLAPIKAMLEQAAGEGVARDVQLYFGARRREDLYAGPELAELEKRWRGKFSFVPVLSGEPEDSDWDGERGFVTEAVRRSLGAQIADHHVYVCGPPPMVDAALSVVRDAGVPDAHVHFDKFLDRSHLLARG
jgi:NAD(P)H-flavin reductase/ferredoxin